MIDENSYDMNVFCVVYQMSIIISTRIFLVQDLEWLIETHMWSMMDRKIKKVLVSI